MKGLPFHIWEIFRVLPRDKKLGEEILRACVMPSQAATDRRWEITIMSTLGISQYAGASAVLAGPLAQALLDMLGRAEHALDIDPRQARIFLGQASRLLESTPERSKPPREGLLPWQESKVLRHIAEGLDQRISNRDLAALTGLSVGHFGCRFKGSFGVSPRGYLIRRRLERVKTLMADTNASLCEIALDSGFCDQAHMSRLFRAAVGSTPSRWRRNQMRPLAA